MRQFGRVTRGTASVPVRPPRPRAEVEADRVAHAVLRSDGRPALHPMEEAPVARTGVPRLPDSGSPLDPADRMVFERRLGADLSTVRVHDGTAAARAAASEHAYGFTLGEHIVLGADADHGVLAHELAHVLQQRRAGRTTVQRQDRPRTAGIGRTPPAVAFDVVGERAPSEDAQVLFGHGSISVAGGDLAGLGPRLQGAARPLVVDIDGYASAEGDADYNLNLSAHRAAAVRAAILPLLPDGSEVRLHAHGATAEFGENAARNRRVGIRVVESPAQPTQPGTAPPAAVASRFRLVPDLRLHSDPSLVPRPPIEPTRPGLIPRLASPPDLVDHVALRQIFTDHGAGALDPRMAGAAEAFTRYWYERYLAMGLSLDRARSLANLGTRIMVGGELEREGKTAADRFNNELQRQGLPTPIGGSVDVLDLWRRLR